MRVVAVFLTRCGSLWSVVISSCAFHILYTQWLPQLVGPMRGANTRQKFARTNIDETLSASIERIACFSSTIQRFFWLDPFSCRSRNSRLSGRRASCAFLLWLWSMGPLDSKVLYFQGTQGCQWADWCSVSAVHARSTWMQQLN